MLSGNIGEWSEVYTFFKLLADGRLHAANADLTLDPNSYYPIVKLMRKQKDFSFDYELDEINIRISPEHKDTTEVVISRSNFGTAASEILSTIAGSTGNFSVPSVNQIIADAHIASLKEPHSDKGDISLVAHDATIGRATKMTFSIKSQLGSPSSLLNASGATNFRFVLSDALSDDDIASLNDLGVKKLVKTLIQRGCEFSLQEVNSVQFATNLKMMDSEMPKLIAALLISYYSGLGTSIIDLVKVITNADPLSIGAGADKVYVHKIKTFLADVALGMTPSIPWSGDYDATAGYIIVKPNGEPVCFHAYNREAFRDYLLNSTRMETASTTRHKFGFLFRIGDQVFIDLNLQVRFI